MTNLLWLNISTIWWEGSQDSMLQILALSIVKVHIHDHILDICTEEMWKERVSISGTENV